MSVDLVFPGDVFGRWTVLRIVERPLTTTQAGRFFECRCACEKQTIRVVQQSSLRAGRSKSCGCFNVDLKTKHGAALKETLNEYRTWVRMMHRCYNPKDKSYKNYGGRGIKVSAEWHDPSVFVQDMGIRPEGLTIERKDVNLGYSKENCIWASRQVQSRNTRRNVYFEWLGRLLALSEIAELENVNYKSLHKKIRYRKMPIAEAVEKLKSLKNDSSPA